MTEQTNAPRSITEPLIEGGFKYVSPEQAAGLTPRTNAAEAPVSMVKDLVKSAHMVVPADFARQLESALAAAQAQIAALQSDIERHVQIASDLATELARLRELLEWLDTEAEAAAATDKPTPSTLGHPACNYNIDGWCHDTQCMNTGKCKIDGQVDVVVRQCETAAATVGICPGCGKPNDHDMYKCVQDHYEDMLDMVNKPAQEPVTAGNGALPFTPSPAAAYDLEPVLFGMEIAAQLVEHFAYYPSGVIRAEIARRKAELAPGSTPRRAKPSGVFLGPDRNE